jgi:hypothetical protein
VAIEVKTALFAEEKKASPSCLLCTKDTDLATIIKVLGTTTFFVLAHNGAMMVTRDPPNLVRWVPVGEGMFAGYTMASPAESET